VNAKALKRYRKHYVPLESNPEVFNKLSHTLGVSSGSKSQPGLQFHDIFSLDEPDLLAMIPRPVLALILVFPTTEVYEQQIAESEESRPEYTGSGEEEDVVWFQQTIHNACGLYGLLHAVSNGKARDFIESGSSLAKLLTTCIPLNPHERALALENSEDVSAAYADAATEGHSAAPDAEAEVDFHYVCFVQSHKTGRLYELDGDKKGPLDKHIMLREDEDMLSENALKVVREFIQREKTNLNFSLMALAETPASSLP